MEENNSVLIITNSPDKNSKLNNSSNTSNPPYYSSSTQNEKHDIYSSKLSNYFNQLKLLIKKLLPSNFNDINNTFIEVKINSITKKIFLLFEKIYKDSNKLIDTYEQMLRKSENEVRSIYRELFIINCKNNSLENDKAVLLTIKKEYDLVRQKTGIYIENGIVVNNNKKDNEIFILHQENSKLKNIIKKNEITFKKNEILSKDNNLMKNEILLLNYKLKELSKEKTKRKIISIKLNSPIQNYYPNTNKINKKYLYRKNKKILPIDIVNNRNITINNLISYPLSSRLNDQSIDITKQKKTTKNITNREKYRPYSEENKNVKKYMYLIDIISSNKKYNSVTPNNKLQKLNYYKKKDSLYNSSFNYNLQLVKNFKKIKNAKNSNLNKRYIPMSKVITKSKEINNNLKKPLLISLNNIKIKNESTLTSHFPSLLSPYTSKCRKIVKKGGGSIGTNNSSLRGRSHSKSNSISMSKMDKKIITKSLLKNSLKRKIK